MHPGANGSDRRRRSITVGKMTIHLRTTPALLSPSRARRHRPAAGDEFASVGPTGPHARGFLSPDPRAGADHLPVQVFTLPAGRPGHGLRFGDTCQARIRGSSVVPLVNHSASISNNVRPSFSKACDDVPDVQHPAPGTMGFGPPGNGPNPTAYARIAILSRRNWEKLSTPFQCPSGAVSIPPAAAAKATLLNRSTAPGPLSLILRWTRCPSCQSENASQPDPSGNRFQHAGRSDKEIHTWPVRRSRRSKKIAKSHGNR